MEREFIRLPEFEKQCKYIGLNEDDVAGIENELLENPTSGDIIQGTVRVLLSEFRKKGKQ